MKRSSIWFQTNLGFEATRQKLTQRKDVIGDMQGYKGILTFYFKGMKDFTIQITTKGKLGIFYPEGSDYNVILEKVSPFLVKADGSQAEILSERPSRIKKESSKRIEVSKETLEFWEDAEYLAKQWKEIFQPLKDFADIQKELHKKYKPR